MHYHEGPWFAYWRQSMAATVLPPHVMGALIEAGVFDGTLLGDG